MRSRTLLFTAIMCSTLFRITGYSQTAEFGQRLRDEYSGKTFILRGFYSGDSLLYDSSGTLVGKEASGDWAADGFVLIDDIRASDARLEIKASRQLVVSIANIFRFQAAEQPTPDKQGVMPVLLKMTVDFGKDVPSAEQAEAVMSKIFLTKQDNLAELLPDYWTFAICGPVGRNDKCGFSKEILAVPGTDASKTNDNALLVSRRASTSPSTGTMFRIGNGVSPPRAIYQPEPEFSQRARQAKFQGIVTLGLVVDRDGIPRNVRILSPLGAGLDEKAVHAVATWRFKPAEKNGEPVAVEIAVEVDFHLY
jgi:TonB family protein